ncbi:hypothetical protein SAMN04488503_0712 [Humidesulfovibrio mexicanus]|uniref:Uncharacterized protein n=1 Tax=Humidesulfovibrio mexicanus TaxID=147047 RepID=A0A238Y704_9BACT|nr:hypothetical protein [Humidesulfovibrio mexicanus]SNR66433.1 hypothetical protein SAMN04488503_0712 [Humidesulfovibrio mexicanus]
MTHMILCPYCHKNQAVVHQGGYEPISVGCESCGKRFVLAPERYGVAVYRIEDAPPCFTPDCLGAERAGSENGEEQRGAPGREAQPV